MVGGTWDGAGDDFKAEIEDVEGTGVEEVFSMGAGAARESPPLPDKNATYFSNTSGGSSALARSIDIEPCPLWNPKVLVFLEGVVTARVLEAHARVFFDDGASTPPDHTLHPEQTTVSVQCVAFFEEASVLYEAPGYAAGSVWPVAQREDTMAVLFDDGHPTVSGLYVIEPPQAIPAQPMVAGAMICKSVSNGTVLAFVFGAVMRKTTLVFDVNSERQTLGPVNAASQKLLAKTLPVWHAKTAVVTSHLKKTILTQARRKKKGKVKEVDSYNQ